jgi:hypothetical protein
MENFVGQCEDSVFMENFKESAPQLMAHVMDLNKEVRLHRDQDFIESVLKTKALLKTIKTRLEDGNAIDLVDFTCSTKMLQHQIKILRSINLPEHAKNEGKEEVIIRVKGVNMKAKINMKKFAEAIVYEEKPKE